MKFLTFPCHQFGASEEIADIYNYMKDKNVDDIDIFKQVEVILKEWCKRLKHKVYFAFSESENAKNTLGPKVLRSSQLEYFMFFLYDQF